VSSWRLVPCVFCAQFGRRRYSKVFYPDSRNVRSSQCRHLCTSRVPTSQKVLSSPAISCPYFVPKCTHHECGRRPPVQVKSLRSVDARHGNPAVKLLLLPPFPASVQLSNLFFFSRSLSRVTTSLTNRSYTYRYLLIGA
jgi:hypothetical protein